MTLPLPLSALDLLPLPSGTDAPQAVRDALELVTELEELGYLRYCVAQLI